MTAPTSQQPPALPLGPFGPYVLEELRRRDGEQIACYRARQPGLDRLVELRVLLPQEKLLRVRFVEQARLLARLQHPAVLGVMDAGSVEGRPYFATAHRRCTRLGELLDGRSGRGLAPLEVLRYGEVLADALGLLHDEGVVHRGLSLESIFYDQDRDSVYLGECSSLFELDGAQLTRRGIPRLVDLVGVPERLEGRPWSPRSDVFQLCGVLYHLLVGRPPFDLESRTLEELQAQGFPEARPLQEVPGLLDACPGLGPVVMRGLARDPDQRPADAGALAAELEGVAQRSDVRLVVREEVQRTRRRPWTLAMERPVDSSMLVWVPPRRSGRAQAKLGLAGLGLAGLGLVLAFLGGGEAPEELATPPAQVASRPALPEQAGLEVLAQEVAGSPTTAANFDRRWDGLRRWVRARGPGGSPSYAEVMFLRGAPGSRAYPRLEAWILEAAEAAEGGAP